MSRTIGIRAPPDQVADELAIRALAYAFADAVNRRDAAAFESLWDETGVWEIGAPLHSSANGPANIAAHMIELAEPLESFVQQVHGGVVTIDGHRATARWSVQETGRTRNNGPYNNHAFYEDELVKRDGAWRFVRQSYRYIWLDLKSPIGGDVIGVGEPGTTRDLERQNMSNRSKLEVTDYDRLMQANLTRVFNERDAGRRILAIRELYAEDAALYEPDTSAKGHAAISEAVTTLLAHLPSNFVFSSAGPAIGHHNIGRLKWRSGPPDGPVAVTGMDVAHFEQGRIHSIYVFLEPTGA